MKRFIIYFLLAFLINASVWAQDGSNDQQTVQIVIPEVAIIDLEAVSGTSITLSVDAPTEAGAPVSFANAVDSSVWLNYSSIIGSHTEATRAISARISSGSVPSGMKLVVVASNDAGNGDGKLGSSSGEVTLSSINQTVVSGIGSCYTGTGASNGRRLKYQLKLNEAGGSYASIDFDESTTLTITYTISNN